MFTCEICGSPMLPSKSNRPKKYCSDNCSNYFKYKEALEKSIIKMSAYTSHSKIIRGDMFRLANIVPKSTNRKEVF